MDIGAGEALDKFKKRDGVIFLDVRTSEEFNEGHIEGAILIPLQDLSEEKFFEKGIKKEDEIIVYCRSGARSMMAAGILENLGYKKVLNLRGGILSWNRIV